MYQAFTKVSSDGNLSVDKPKVLFTAGTTLHMSLLTY